MTPSWLCAPIILARRRAFHLDVQTGDKYVHRISIGNMYQKRVAGVRGIQCQFDAPPDR